MKLSSLLYRLARLGRDANAISRGPHAFVKRQIRKVLYKEAGKVINKVVPPK